MADVELDVLLEDDFSGPARKVSSAASQVETRLNSMSRLINARTNRFAKMGSAVGVLGRKLGAVNTRFDKFGSNLASSFSDKLGLNTSITDRIAGGITGLLGGLAKFSAAAIAAFAAAGAAAAAYFSQLVFQAAKSRESLSLALGQLRRGDVNLGTEEFEKVKKLSQEMRTDLTKTAEVMRDFAGGGFSDAQATEMFKRFQDMKAVGWTDEGLDRALLAIRQIKATGKLQGDELMQLSDAGLESFKVYDALGKMMGKTRAEVIKLKEAGKISDVQAIQAIMMAMEAEVGGGVAGELAKGFKSSTVTGAIETLQSIWSNFVDTVAVKAEPAFKSIGAAINDINSAMQTDSFDSWAETLGAVFNLLGKFGQGAWEGIKAYVEGFQSAMDSGDMEKIQKSLEIINEAFGGSDEGMKGVAQTIGALIAKVVTITVMFAALAVKIGEFFYNLGTIGGRVAEAVGEATGAVLSFPGTLWTSGMTAGGNLIDGLVSGIQGGMGRVTSAVGNLSSSISDKFTNFWGINSPSKRMQRYTMNIAQGGAIGFDRGAPMFNSAMSDMTSPGESMTVSSPSASLDFSNLAGAMFSAGSGAGGGGGGGGVEVNVNINVQGGGGSADEEWERLRPRVRREIEMGLRTAGEL